MNMSYDPPRRRLLPRQGGWPQATPPRAWPAQRDDSAYRDADRPIGQDEGTGEGSHWTAASSQPQPAYQGQPAYQRELPYQGQAVYQGQPSYLAQPAYQGGPAYEQEPAYQGGRGYESHPAYQGTPGYQDQTGYGAQPDYQAEPGYQDAFDGSADNEYRDYRPTRVIESLPAAPDGYAYGRGGPDGGSAVTGYYAGEPADGFDSGDNGYGVATDGFDGAGDGYGAPDAYADYGNGNGWSGHRYQDASRGGYGLDAPDYFDGAPDYVDEASDGFAGNQDGLAGGAEQRDRDYYAEPRPSGPMLMAPDAGILPHHWQAGRDRRREQRRRGLMVGAVTGFLAAAVAIGVTTLAAAFVRPQVSPIVAVGNVFIDRTPGALKNLAVAHFGQHGRTVLLLGMFVIIALLAMVLGVLTRRAPALGVASIAAGVLAAAFVTITRPQDGPRDVIPWVIGGLAGVAALLWLVRSSAPAGPVRPARDGSRRRGR